MYSATAYSIRRANADDAAALLWLAGLDSRSPLEGRVLVGEIDGIISAAVSIDHGDVIANPFRPTAGLVSHLRMRAGGIVAADRRPSLRDRIRDGIRVSPRSPVARAAWPRHTPLHQLGGG